MPPPDTPTLPRRLASVDAYRGFVMFLMMAEVLHLGTVAASFRGSRLWAVLSRHQTHVEWVGCSLHDLIQPSFSFLVGVALPFSIAGRVAWGESRLRMLGHATWRALVLVALGVFLRSVGKPQTNYTFEDTLSQIGLGYVFLFLLGLGSTRLQWAALGVILVGYGAAFALYPGSGTDFAYASVGVPADWPHLATGFAAHWNKNSNLAWAFDTWFLNLFPRPRPFRFNGGGYATLSFIPTLGTMILGLLAGNVVRGPRSPGSRLGWLVAAGLIGLFSGWALGALGVCPVVKRIWTPTWVLFSGGWCFLLLAAFHVVIDLWDWKGWAFPLIVIGMNSIAAYCMAELIEGFLAASLTRHLGRETFQVLGAPYEPLLLGAAVLAVLWLILFWMYRRKLFLRV